MQSSLDSRDSPVPGKGEEMANLPKGRGGWSVNRFMRTQRGRNLAKGFKNLCLTMFAGFMTIMVLRGPLTVSQSSTKGLDMRTSGDDLGTIREPARTLTEVKVELQDPVDLEEEAERAASAGVPYSLGPKISDWDDQRQSWLDEHPEMKLTKKGKPRILLVTGSQPYQCKNAIGDHYLLKALKNKIDYGRLHDIEIFYNMAHLDHEMAGYWAKLPLLRRLMLMHPEVEWIWWMDSDAFFTDMVFEIPVDKYKEYNFVLHGWDEMIYKEKSWVGLNTGSFLLRNCQWSLDLMDAWSPMGPKGPIRDEAGKVLSNFLAGRPDFEADDQSALVYLLITQKDVWSPRVFLENKYYLHGFWKLLVEQYEENMKTNHPGFGDARWPFVTHFVGCKPCGGYGDYPMDLCLSRMERAFNFADNQVLEMYGYQHRSLGSYKVKRTRNDSSIPLEVLQQHSASQR